MCSQLLPERQRALWEVSTGTWEDARSRRAEGHLGEGNGVAGPQEGRMLPQGQWEACPGIELLGAVFTL